MSAPLASFLQDPDFIDGAYLVALVLFILGLRGLSGPKTARRGNGIAAVGMLIAVVATLLDRDIASFELIALGLVIGIAVGVPSARAVKMTAMPQMVALFNGVGGGAVALIAWAEFRHANGDLPLEAEIPVLFGALVGSVSFWGSNIAFGKLQEVLPGRPITVPFQQVVNGLVLLAALACAGVLIAGSESEAVFLGLLLAAAIFGNLVVLPVGGADMPVMISLLNALTGLSAAAAGMALDNPALIVAGMLVGASGTILTNLMAQAMNRSIPAIVAGGFGGDSGGGGKLGDRSDEVHNTSPDDTAIQLTYAEKVVFVPGYGLAVAQAQHVLRELADELEKRGVEVAYAIHPVAGRMPGHMNVLLAEADVPYEQLKEMDEINREFDSTDVSLIVGANDVTNPAARDQTDSPIYGMPILDVDKSERVIVIKRSLSPGYAGIDNELYYDEGTQMLFGDAKASIQGVLEQVKAL